MDAARFIEPDVQYRIVYKKNGIAAITIPFDKKKTII